MEKILLLERIVFDKDKKGVSLCKLVTDEQGNEIIERRAFRLEIVLEEDQDPVPNDRFTEEIDEFVEEQGFGQQVVDFLNGL